MQKHKKYLVVTVWVSTIAFVGAGFVGWGSVNFGSSGSSVAQVGDVEVTQSELQREYSRIYQFYNQLSGGKFDKEQAEKMGLQNQAMQNLITQAMMQNFAQELGLQASDEEVARKVVNMKSFQQDGKFSKDIYEKLLFQNNYKVSEFESALKKEALIGKLHDLIELQLTKLEHDTVAAAFYMRDRLEIEMLSARDFSPVVMEEDIHGYWEQNQAKYQTKKTFHISYVLHKSSEFQPSKEDLKQHYEENRNSYRDEDGKILNAEEASNKVEMDVQSKMAEKQALLSYIDLKKDKVENLMRDEVEQGDDRFGVAFMQALASAKEGSVVKPVETPGGYMTFRLDKVQAPEPMPYEVAKSLAEKDLLKQKQAEMLSAKAEQMMKDGFQGKQVGWVTRDDISKIEGLNQQEATQFLTQLFESREPKGVIHLSGKAVLYAILEQQLLNTEKIQESEKFITQNAAELKQRLSQTALLKNLQQRYQVTN